MKSLKLIAIFLAAALSSAAQVVQPMGFTDYSVYGSMNIGNGKLKPTASSAYLELGDALHSRKGLLMPRGNKDSVQNPVRGLVIYDIPSAKIQMYDGTSWAPLGAAAGLLSGTGTGGRVALWNSGSTLGNSQLYDDGNNVGIGIAPHQVFKLYVNGHAFFNGTIGTLAAVHTGADYKVMVDANGYFRYVPNVGVGNWGGLTGDMNTQLDLIAKFNTYQPLLSVGDTTQVRLGDHSLTNLKNAVIAAGLSYWAPLGHKHLSADVTDLTPVVRNMFTGGTGINVNSSSGVITYTGADSTTAAAALKTYTDAFAGTTANQFTLSKSPLLQTIVVNVNGQRIPRSYWTLLVQTVAINAGLLTFTTETNDIIEITYQSTF